MGAPKNVQNRSDKYVKLLTGMPPYNVPNWISCSSSTYEIPGFPYLNIMTDDGDVLEVQGGVNLVHDVERRRLVVMQGEDEGEGGKRLLAAAQIRYLFPSLLGRSDAEANALGEWVERIF